MRTSINLGSSALTPSGTGEECFRIKFLRDDGTPIRKVNLHIEDEDGGKVDVVMDERHLGALYVRINQAIGGARVEGFEPL